jgi:hypothetical protein
VEEWAQLVHDPGHRPRRERRRALEGPTARHGGVAPAVSFRLASSHRRVYVGVAASHPELAKDANVPPRLRSVSVRGWNPAFARVPQTRAAIEYAERRHAGQRRADGAPFILHPLEVAALLHDRGAADHLIAAGVLHDVAEKADGTAPELRERLDRGSLRSCSRSAMTIGSWAIESARRRCAGR